MRDKHEITDIVLGFLGSLVMILGLNLFNKFILISIPLVFRMIIMIVMYWFIALIPVVIMFVRKDKISYYGFSKNNIGKQVLAGVLIGITFSIVFTVIPNLLGIGDWVSSNKQYRYLWQFIYEFIYRIVAVGLTEEFIFRGFLYAKIEKISNSTIAVVVSSIMFGLFHIFSGNILQVIVTGFLGVIFCLCKNKIKYSTVLSLIFAHGIYDALIVVCTYLFNK